MKEKLQRIGQVMLIPVSVITVASLFMGLGSAFTSDATIASLGLSKFIHQGTLLFNFFTIMKASGDLVFGNLPLFFAIGISFGLADKEKGWAAFSGAIAFVAMHTIISTLFKVNNITPDTTTAQYFMDTFNISNIEAVRKSSIYYTELGIFTYRLGVFGGLIVGVVTSKLHNKLYNVKLPMVLEFFAGTRTVSIVMLVVGSFLGFVMYYVWPPIGLGLSSLGIFINKSGLIGTFVWAALDKALLPFGLHHLLTTPIRLTELGGSMNIDGQVIQGTTNIYMAQIASSEPLKFLVRGFQSGRVTLHFGALPAAALAMYKCAPKAKRKSVAGILIPVVLTMILFGVTEPIEFTFLFVAPWLFFLVHVPLTGLAFVLTEYFNVSIYGGCVKDILPVLFQPEKLYITPYLFLIPLFFVIYYFAFKYAILKFNLKTPGREDDDKEIKLYSKKEYREKVASHGDVIVKRESTFDSLTLGIISALGEKENIEVVDNCMTRLRVRVIDAQKVASDDIWRRELDAKGVVRQGNSLQIIYGTKVTMIAADVREAIGLN